LPLSLVRADAGLLFGSVALTLSLAIRGVGLLLRGLRLLLFGGSLRVALLARDALRLQLCALERMLAIGADDGDLVRAGGCAASAEHRVSRALTGPARLSHGRKRQIIAMPLKAQHLPRSGPWNRRPLRVQIRSVFTKVRLIDRPALVAIKIAGAWTIIANSGRKRWPIGLIYWSRGFCRLSHLHRVRIVRIVSACDVHWRRGCDRTLL